MTKKILALVLHRRDRSPGQRYRYEQYLPFFEENGFDFISSNLLSEKGDAIFYRKGRVLGKVLIGMRALLKRVIDVFRGWRFNNVYIYRDAFFFGIFIERMMKWSGAKIIYDFDDAIWLMDKNPNQGVFNRLKNPDKTAKLIGLADRVIVGNEYLKAYALQFNSEITVIPSTIDFSEYSRFSPKNNDKICIGWTGSFSTIKHFETVIPVLEKIKMKYGEAVYFKLIGDPTYVNENLGVVGNPWRSESESEDLSELDIGLMPLPDNEWTRGKCAMKGLQYMALEIPTIMSPVGVNSDIIQDGENGFLAGTEDEWVEKLSLLIEDESLRVRLGKAGRKTVEEGYSVEANKEKWLSVFQDRN